MEIEQWIKCVHLRFCQSDPLVESIYYINDNPIPVKSNHTNIGVIVACNLSWQAHHDYIASRAYRLLGLLRRTFSSVDSVHEKKVLSTLPSSDPFYYIARKYQDILKIEKIQGRATKYILHDYTSTTSLD